MSEEELSQQALYEFVEKHNLQDNNSQIRFSAIVMMRTEKKEIEEEMSIRIVKDVYNRRGQVILNNDLEPYEFPQDFFPDFQLMEHAEGRYLKIIGEHHLNPNIGKYVVEIHPIYND